MENAIETIYNAITEDPYWGVDFPQYSEAVATVQKAPEYADAPDSHWASHIEFPISRLWAQLGLETRLMLFIAAKSEAFYATR